MIIFSVNKTATVLNYSTQHQQIALTLLSGIGSRRARVIISYFNDLDAFFLDKKLDLEKLPGVTHEMIRSKQREEALQKADEVLEAVERQGGQLHFFGDTNYPKKLKQCADAPIVLYSKGNIDFNARRVVSIVGTRNITPYGKQLTEELVDTLAAAGAVVVSGMAYGVDICAHKRAVFNAMPTWGVLGHGLDKLYPAVHRKTAERMLENGGLITEFVPGADIDPGNFPMRNRIVAGLCDATIVVESGVSGGSMITANLARDYNREVFAFPGDVGKPNSAGCLKLIGENIAGLVQSGADVLKVMEWDIEEKALQQTRIFPQLSTEEALVMHVFNDQKEQNLDSIGFFSKLPIPQVSALLLNLEFKGLIRSLPGRRFALV